MKRAQLIEEVAEGMVAIKRVLGASRPGRAEACAPTRAQIHALIMVAHEGPQNLKELAGRLHMTPSAATQLVDVLVTEKLLARTPDAKDRRKIRLALTASGMKRLQFVQKRYLATFAKLLASLSEAELAQWSKLQKKVISHLS